jgi:hypothetical protein
MLPNNPSKTPVFGNVVVVVAAFTPNNRSNAFVSVLVTVIGTSLAAVVIVTGGSVMAGGVVVTV